MYDELILRLRKDAEFLEISSKYNNTVNEFAERISQAADVIEKLSKERKRSKWIQQTLEVKPFGEDTVLCDQCGFMTDRDSGYKFCPNCGAEMSPTLMSGT